MSQLFLEVRHGTLRESHMSSPATIRVNQSRNWILFGIYNKKLLTEYNFYKKEKEAKCELKIHILSSSWS